MPKRLSGKRLVEGMVVVEQNRANGSGYFVTVNVGGRRHHVDYCSFLPGAERVAQRTQRMLAAVVNAALKDVC